MRKYGWGVLAALVLMMLTVAPLSVKADSIAMNAQVNAGGGDENAHFDFRGGPKGYHPVIWKAAMRLREARRALWTAKGDFQGHRLKAIGAIDAALDELKMAVSAADRR
jgi:hypothetical protein